MPTPDSRPSDLRLRVLDGRFDYADGAEDVVLKTLAEATDVSSGSDELAAHIVDWPTQYHFSRLRANVVRPLLLGPQHRVLDVGAGTGAIARYVGEQGARVVALEGSLSRATACATRCRDLDNVETIAGSLEAFTASEGDAFEPFDVVLCIGVLEYNAGPRGEATAIEFLRSLVRILRPGGSLVVAIENQLGLKYLLGYAEDHHPLPYLGIEGYPAVTGARTFSRQRLGELLEAVGMTEQRWLFPFPDYKHPRAILDRAAYAQDDVVEFVDGIVRWPVSGAASARLRMADDRRAHRELLAAGLGPDVSNSFLVVSTAPDRQGATAAPLLEPEFVAQHYSGERLRRWMRQSRITSAPGAGLRVTSSSVFGEPGVGAAERRTGDAITQQPIAARPFVFGTTVEQSMLDACANDDIDRATSLLRSWHATITQDARAVEPGAVDAAGLFRDASTTSVLAPVALDSGLPNFVASGASLVSVDDEWEGHGGVDARLVVLRALWAFASEVVLCGVRHPWSSCADVDALAVALGHAAGLDVGADDLERFRDGEATLLELVHGTPRSQALANLERIGQLGRSSAELPGENPFTTIIVRVRELEHDVARLQPLEVEVVAQREYTTRLEHDLAERASSAAAAHAELDATRAQLNATKAEVDAWAARWKAWERRDPLLWLAPRAKVIARRVRGPKQ